MVGGFNSQIHQKGRLQLLQPSALAHNKRAPKPCKCPFKPFESPPKFFTESNPSPTHRRTSRGFVHPHASDSDVRRPSAWPRPGSCARPRGRSTAPRRPRCPGAAAREMRRGGSPEEELPCRGFDFAHERPQCGKSKTLPSRKKISNHPPPLPNLLFAFCSDKVGTQLFHTM